LKIIKIDTYIVNAYRLNWVFVRISTDQGLVGWGESSLEYKAQAVATAIHELERYLIGQDPLLIEAHYERMFRDGYWRVGPVLMSAISGVEMALWDILGKHLGVPVFQLLGGMVNDRVRLYANGWFKGATQPEHFARAAKRAQKRGFKALKWDPFGQAYMEIGKRELAFALDCVAAVKQAVGDEVDLLIEGHGRFNLPTAIRIARLLEPYEPRFFEEPIPPDNFAAMGELRGKSTVPIAAGERVYTVYGFEQLLASRGVDYIQPDVSHAGGLMQLKKIAAMAQARYVGFAAHNPSGPIANAATLQLAACTPNYVIHEIMATDVPWRGEVVDEELVFENGDLLIPTKPGLGVDIRVDELEKHPYKPVDIRHYSGSLTDIRPSDEKPYF
jgi:galactonate dehydratase